MNNFSENFSIGKSDVFPQLNLGSTTKPPCSNLMGPNHPHFINRLDQNLHKLPNIYKEAKYDPISAPGLENK